MALAVPLMFTVEVEIKFVPFTVSVNAPEPATTVVGATVVTVGTGFVPVTVKVTELDVPPPGAGLVTVTAGVPAAVTSEARIAAVSCVAFTNEVTRAVPLKFTVDPLMKFVPFTVSVNAPDPATTLVGDKVVTVGTGFAAAAPS